VGLVELAKGDVQFEDVLLERADGDWVRWSFSIQGLPPKG